MLSYKDYKKLNESLYGAFNLGLKGANVVGGIVSASSVNGTEAALEAQAEEAIEEAKKMKKKMESDEEHDEEEVKEKNSDEGEDSDEGHDEDEHSDEEKEEDSDEESDEEDEEESDPKFMKKKAKKEWTEVLADLEAVLEDVSNEANLAEIKKGLEIIREGAKKGHKKGCDCNFCKSAKAKKEDKGEGDGEGLTAGQKKLPKALQDAILAKKDKKGEKEDKKCGKYMKEDDAAWWNSVNSMLGTEDQKGWDGWTEVGEIETAIRDEQNPV